MPEFFQWLMERELPFGLHWHPDAEGWCFEVGDRRCYGATMEAAMQDAPEWAEWQRKEAQVPLFGVPK